MRSYFISFALVTALLAGYTALVLKSNSPIASKAQAPHATEADHRQPAASSEVIHATTDATSVD